MPPETIPWSKTVSLKWTDFKAEPNPAVFEDSSSIIRYRITWTVNSEVSRGQIEFFVEDLKLITEFYPGLSWVRSMYATAELLNHEQGHFDLAELMRNDITAGINNAINKKRHAVAGKNDEQRKQFAREHSAILLADELKKWQSHMEQKRTEYNRQTNFGQNVEIQSDYDMQFSQLRR